MSTNKIVIALAGNPNSGKTTMFNSMTGSNQKVGNYPGVTVEKKEGHLNYKGIDFHIYDLPGTYSLTAYSPDEVVARDFIIGEKPDVIVDVIDSTNLERNLFLCLQLQELGLPVVGALNIIDQAEDMGIRIQDKELSSLLGIPLVRTSGAKGKGIEQLLDTVIEYLESKTEKRSINYGSEIELEIQSLIAPVEKDCGFCEKYPPRWIAIKLLEKDNSALELLSLHEQGEDLKSKTKEAIKRIEKHFGLDSEIVISEQRYAYIHGAMAETVSIKEKNGRSVTELIDKILLNRIVGLPFFFFVIWSIFQLTFKLGELPMLWIENIFGSLSAFATATIPEGILRSIVVDGMIAGVGGVFSFIPLIIILFMLLSILEDTGYMSRAAFLSDRFLHLFGLHGQSFMPMMLGFGCSVPAIMAARALKSQKDRIITILITPFMSCSAKLPVHVLLAAAFFPNNAGNVVMSIYFIGIVLGLISSFVFSKILLKGKESPFVMELPPYRMPTVNGILWHVFEKSWMYIKKAGTVILAASILIWAITAFPVSNDSSKQLEQSIAGRAGKVIEPFIAPIGFDWKIGVASITGFAAKEVVVSTLGVLYQVGEEEDESSQSLRQALVADKKFTPLVAYGLMLFMLILAPCFAAQAVMRAEIGWGWVGFHFIYTTALAWTVCFVVYQGGRMLGLG